MDLSEKVLGAHIVRQLRTRAGAPILTIGRDTFTRADLSKVACFNFVAAANLSAILNKELKVADTRDVFERIAPGALALPRLGAISLACLGAAFECKHLGGASPLETWVKHHLDAGQKMVTFSALKHHDEAQRAAERAEWRRRKHARRNQAHRARVGRFEKRQGVAS